MDRCALDTSLILHGCVSPKDYFGDDNWERREKWKPPTVRVNLKIHPNYRIIPKKIKGFKIYLYPNLSFIPLFLYIYVIEYKVQFIYNFMKFYL